jgi:trehalose 6-phosphate phosphatase
MTFEALTATLPSPKPLKLAGCALFLDLDGTLAPIAARPQDVRPDPWRTERLQKLAAVHGLVRRDACGTVQTSAPHPAIGAVFARLHAFAARDSGLIIEDKGLSVALHFRLARSHGADARRLAETLAAETGLTLQHGDMVEELRTPGPDKGDSVRGFMAQTPFMGAQPVFVGDDDTDEDGFAAVAALGGFGVLVGPPRSTAARFRLAGVEAAATWLEAAR